MQIRFDRQPEDHHLMKLKEAGWTDRTESEGIWTKQVAPGEWKPVADAERLFKDIANAIRKGKGPGAGASGYVGSVKLLVAVPNP